MSRKSSTKKEQVVVAVELNQKGFFDEGSKSDSEAPNWFQDAGTPNQIQARL